MVYLGLPFLITVSHNQMVPQFLSKTQMMNLTSEGLPFLKMVEFSSSQTVSHNQMVSQKISWMMVDGVLKSLVHTGIFFVVSTNRNNHK